MSENTDGQATHEVVSSHTRTTGSRDREVLEPGDEVTPTDAELRAFSDKFRPLDADEDDEDAERIDEDEPGLKTNEDTDGIPDADDDVESAENDDEDEDEAEVETDEDALDPDEVDDADRRELQTMAREFDDINGNWGNDRLRAELKATVEDGED